MESMRSIMSNHGTIIGPIGKWTVKLQTPNTELLPPSTGNFYVKDTTGWVKYTFRMYFISTRCDPIYIIQAQV